MTTIVTHSGCFHADECLAIFMLRSLNQYKNAPVLRTRDPQLIEAPNTVVVDVGGVYDPQRHRYDHHQREFTGTFYKEGGARKSITKLSSAGLVYVHFGYDVVKAILSKETGTHQASAQKVVSNANLLEQVYQKVYVDFIEGVDAVDNGVTRFPSSCAVYKEATSLSHRVSRLNPWWNEHDVDVDERFAQAVELAGNDFETVVRQVALSWLPGRDIVIQALESRFKWDPSGTIVVLEQFCPWKEHLFDLEKELAISKNESPLYVIYEDSTGSSWRVQAVPVDVDAFESRKPLPEPWRGVRDDALSELADIPGCVFVHASGFIGGNKTKDGALLLAKKSLAFV